MLRRVISAIVLIIILVPLYITGNRPFQLAVGILALLGLKELIDLKKGTPNGIVLLAMCTLLFLLFYEFEVHNLEVSYIILAVMSLLFLLPTLIPYKNKEYLTSDALELIGSILFLGVSFHTIIKLRNHNVNLLTYLIIIPIITDIFAYFIGRWIGKRKMAPNISPNKTWAGSVGGSLLGTLVGTIFYVFLINDQDILKIVVMTFVLSIMGQLGDLLFSKIKREHGIKDFSNLIPEHGGVLDRFDSLIFVILTFIVLGKFL